MGVGGAQQSRRRHSAGHGARATRSWNVRSVLRVAVAADKNKDGIYNDAPAVVPDANRDGRINATDLNAYGVASNIAVVPFTISD
jgi:hypothetical protein